MGTGRPELGDSGRTRAILRGKLLLLAGSLSAEDAKTLRAAIKTVRKNWR